MRYLPKMPVIPAPVKRQVIEFKGYSDGPTIADGEMRDMKNLCSDEYPMLTQRKPRELYSESLLNPVNIYTWKGQLAVVASYNGANWLNVGGKWITPLTAGEKQIAGINQKLCVFPDKICYNLVTGLAEKLEAVLTEPVTTVTINSIAFNCDDSLLAAFSAGDTVAITGFTETKNNITAKIKSIAGSTVTFPDNSLVVPSAAETGNITMSRTIPDMDYVIESNNRLWGCKGNLIYSCKLGDPKNWNELTTLAGSAYAAEVGTDGDFTGCAAYPDHLLFFKEGYIHKLYGNNKPSTYQIVTIQCHGLEAGSNKSIVCVNNVLFYKSRMGIMAYSAGYPSLITQDFRYSYKNAVAGTNLLKYYVSMQRDDGTWDFMVYDISRKMWHLEDNTHASMFSYHNGRLMYINAAENNNRIFYTSGSDPVAEDKKMEWYAVFGDYDEYSENKKIYSKLQMRMVMDDDAELTVSISVDGGPFENVRYIYNEHKRTMCLPIKPRRCDRFSIRVEGRGRTKIESIVRICREGSGL